jgi:predicted Zn-dependent protease
VFENRRRNYLVFYSATVNGKQAAGFITKLSSVDLLDPSDLYNSRLTKACKEIEDELGCDSFVLTNIIYRGIVEP